VTEQRDEGILHDVFSRFVAQPERTRIAKQLTAVSS
jgi:hypothetical protein